MIKAPLKFHIRPLLNPFIWYQIDNIGDYCGINTETKRENAIILSLTSYRDRFSKLPITLYSLLNQKLKPDKIILWLDEDSEEISYLPYEITQFIKNGLEIRFVKDLKSYTKFYYAFSEFSNSIIVTADDDIYYPSNWLEKLYYSYAAHPEDIHVHRAHRVIVGEHNSILPYEQWEKHVKEESARYDNFLTGVGGVLYPPKCFSSEILRKDIFLKNAPTADDIWLWIMALSHDRKIRVVKNHQRNLIITDIFSHFFGENLYNKNSKGANDIQFNNLMKFYKQNVMNKIV